MNGNLLTYTINDTTYAYQLHGKGQPIVLLHGFTGSQSTWSKVTRKLKKDFLVITIDLPGHGKTNFNQPLSMELLCQDLVKLFTHLNLSNIHLVGYSMGGRIALTFSMLYPEWLGSLTLESSSPGLKLASERKARIKQDEILASKLAKGRLRSFVSFWEDLPLFASQKKLPSSVQKEVRGERLSQSPSGLARSLRLMGTGRQPSWWDQLANLTIPVLLIVGELDEKFVQINKQMNSYLSMGEIVIIEDTGHTVHIEQPDIFREQLFQFIIKSEKIN